MPRDRPNATACATAAHILSAAVASVHVGVKAHKLYGNRERERKSERASAPGDDDIEWKRDKGNEPRGGSEFKEEGRRIQERKGAGAGKTRRNCCWINETA